MGLQQIFRDAIRNPAEPEHCMLVQRIERRVTVSLGGTLLACSDGAVYVIEFGRGLYPPVIYLPSTEVRVSLARAERTTHCPLKGDASYFDLVDGSARVADIAWAYEEPFAFAAVLRPLLAFDPARASFTLAPLAR